MALAPISIGFTPMKSLCGETYELTMNDLKDDASARNTLIERLASDHEFAVSFVKTAMEKIGSTDERGAGLLALRLVAEAHGGLGTISDAAEVSRPSIYRMLSSDGNPTLKTLIAVLKTVGLRLSVEKDNGPPVQLNRRKPGRPRHE